MSRCFPFPPPGYERKARPDDVNLLKKEKHKEKKHKTENKDREKREEKEKREKDRSHEKHREKKDKKEKHRDRDRDKKKDKDKDKEKIHASDEKKNPGRTESHSGGNVVPKDGKDKNNGVHKRISGPLAGYKTEKINQDSQLDEECMDSKLVQELGRRIKDDSGGSGSQIENCTPSVQTKDEGMVRLVVTDNEVGIRGETSVTANATVDASDGTTRPFDKNAFRKVGRKEKEFDDKCGENRKERDKEKKSHGKDKVRDKDEEKSKEKIKVKSIEADKIRENNKNHINFFHLTKTFQLPMDSNRSGSTDGNLKKRKDLETNGVLHANDFRPRKLPRHAPSSPMENGRKLESCQTSIFHALDEQGAANNLKVGCKEREQNGIVEAQQSSFTPMKLKSPETRADSANASRRLPHPDSKYVSQIYFVPKIEECSECDDQEWLFGGNESELKKSNTEALRVGMPQVWAEALQIGSADVCALPYVIPY